MSHPQSSLPFNPTCALNSTWYACGTTFLGCCSTNACTPKGCPQGNLSPVAFDAAQHGNFPDASCGPGANFWTCAAGPTFWGCCKGNPCATGVCPDDELVPAFVGSPVQEAYYLGETTAATATPSVVGDDGGEKSHTGAIAGGVAGGVVGVLLLCWVVYYIWHLRRRGKDRYQVDGGNDFSAKTAEHAKMGGGYESAPPVYTSPQSTPNIPHNAYGFGSYHPEAQTYAYHAGPTWKAQHHVDPLELPAETTWRGELEGPLPEPQVKSTYEAPLDASEDAHSRSGSRYYSEAGVERSSGLRSSRQNVVFEEVIPVVR